MFTHRFSPIPMLAFLLWPSLAPSQSSEAIIEPVTTQELESPPPSDWLSFRGNLSSWAYSPLELVDGSNVAHLSLAWAVTMEAGPNESAPLARGGVLYVPNPRDVIQALDARTGDLIWEYRRELPTDVAEGSPPAVAGPIHRNVAIWDDGIFASTADAHVIRLDANTGELVWETKVGDDQHITHTSGPIIAGGRVVSGRTCDMGLPGGCFITAHDPESGRELWRFYPIPRPGEPGDETWGGLPLEKRFHVGAWFVGSYDPELDLIYWGTSVPAPSPEFLRGTGEGEMLYSTAPLRSIPRPAGSCGTSNIYRETTGTSTIRSNEFWSTSRSSRIWMPRGRSIRPWRAGKGVKS